MILSTRSNGRPDFDYGARLLESLSPFPLKRGRVPGLPAAQGFGRRGDKLLNDLCGLVRVQEATAKFREAIEELW